jgi:hypothetical protein
MSDDGFSVRLDFYYDGVDNNIMRLDVLFIGRPLANWLARSSPSTRTRFGGLPSF